MATVRRNTQISPGLIRPEGRALTEIMLGLRNGLLHEGNNRSLLDWFNLDRGNAILENTKSNIHSRRVVVVIRVICLPVPLVIRRWPDTTGCYYIAAYTKIQAPWRRAYGPM